MNTVESPSGAKKPGGFALWAARLQMAHGRKLVIALPYLWLILLFMLPFLIVFKISLAEMARAIPPYTELMEWADGQLTLTLNFANFLQLTDDPLYFEAYLQSLQVAGISTICCLLLGYPLAWAVAHSKPSTRNILLLLVILPSWTSFLIRVYAWMGLLKSNGVLNNFLLWLGVIDQPLEILHTNLAVYIGIVYAGGLAGSRRPAAEDLLPGDRPAHQRRHYRWLHAGVYPGGRRVRDPGTAGRAGQHHDWPRAVAGVL